MSTKVFDENDLYDFVRASDGVFPDDKWYDNHDELAENENYQKLTEKQKEKFTEDVKKISLNKKVIKAQKALDEFIDEDKSDYSDEEYMEERQAKIDNYIKAILSTKEAQKYYKED